MQIHKVPIGSIIPDPENARRHPQRNIETLMGSLSMFGQQRPLVVWQNVVIAGNGTLEAARALGWSEIEITRVPPDWDYDMARAYALTDNRTSELSHWDPQVLADQLLELDAVGWDVSDFGFAALQPPTDPEPLPEIPFGAPCPTCGRFT